MKRKTMTSKPHSHPGQSRFYRAADFLERGDARRAFRLFLAGAKAGDPDCQLNLGWLYDSGQGVRKNRKRALHWYRLAYGKGSASAANNIGTIFRDDGRLNEAIKWFERAIQRGSEDSHLEIAKILLLQHDSMSAVGRLRVVTRSDKVAVQTREQALRLLRRLS
jgi:TPR repeat protein